MRMECVVPPKHGQAVFRIDNGHLAMLPTVNAA